MLQYSHHAKYKLAMKGDTFPPIGMPNICLNIFPLNCTYVLKRIISNASNNVSIVYFLQQE